MSDFENASDRFGFSTGALELGDFRSALSWMNDHDMKTVELSALRFDELEPLVSQLGKLDLDAYQYVSFHAPSAFSPEQEGRVIELLKPVYDRQWNIVVHPDVIHTPQRWEYFGSRLLIENMDRRKHVGRTVFELEQFFDALPSARLCLDVAHARQIDSTLSLVTSLIRSFGDRIAELHISELDGRCRHVAMSSAAVEDYRQIASLIPSETHVIIESMLDSFSKSVRLEELQLARAAMRCPPEETTSTASSSAFSAGAAVAGAGDQGMK
ncbi:MAG: hypothetical protein AAGI48_13005 [Verrucomicrobiota bacterium]